MSNLFLSAVAFLPFLMLILSAPKESKPVNNIPISIYYVHLQAWIKSCKRPRQLVIANRMVTAFKERYRHDKNFSYYATKLCCDLQMKRIEIQCNAATKTV